MGELSRDPGTAIKDQLRREVNFGCPVRYADGSGCGSPILTFHHFDPPWAIGRVHNPEGMIALCPQHHNQADGGLWSIHQLRSMKKSPYVDDALRVRWPWQPETLVMKVGPCLVLGSGSPLRLSGRPVMHFRPVEIKSLGARTVQFDSDIRDRSGRPWLRIEESWFDLHLAGTTKLEFTPQLKLFQAKNIDNTFITMQFERMPIRSFQDWAQRFMTNPGIAANVGSSAQKAGAVDRDGYISVVTFGGRFRSKEVDVKVSGDQLITRVTIPGRNERVKWHTWIVDSERRATLRMVNQSEFFSLG